MTKKELTQQILEKKSYLCIGLDTDLGRIPKHLLEEKDPIFAFNKAISHYPVNSLDGFHVLLYSHRLCAVHNYAE